MSILLEYTGTGNYIKTRWLNFCEINENEQKYLKKFISDNLGAQTIIDNSCLIINGRYDKKEIEILFEKFKRKD